MHCGQLPLAFWVLIFISIAIYSSFEEHCYLRDTITAVEGEPFYLKYCPLTPDHKNETDTIKWFKCNKTHIHVELNSSSSPRITLHDDVLEFWPVKLNDSGSYCVQMGNNTQQWKLNVTQRSKHSCFAEKQVKSRSVEVGKVLNITCENSLYNGHQIYRTALFKNCEEIKNIKDPSLWKNAEFEDQGYYTCVFSFYHNGKPFNITDTTNITIDRDRYTISPVFHGPQLTYVRVALGKDVELNCSALGNKDDYIFWIIRNESGMDPNVHEEEQTKIKTAEGTWRFLKVLKIRKINENNLKFSYNCTMSGVGGTNSKSFILLKEDNMVDISGDVFTRGMIVAVLSSVVVVCLVIMGVIYRVDLALFYRHLMGRDETLTDGKTYDAFVSYRPESGEEHTFAVETLPRVLEKHFGYKLCIFERDVMPGGAVVDEVHSLIEKSRRLIIILSKSYMPNEVRYELESGLHEALVERKIKIIIIKFTPVSDFTFLPQSLKLLKPYRILKWKTDKSLSHNSRFWKNLLYLMPAKTVKPCTDESEVLPCFHSPDLQKS